MYRSLVTVPLLMASLVVACSDTSVESPPPKSTESAATLPSEEQTTVSCIAPDEFGRRTGITSVEVPVLTQYEFGNDAKSKPVRYPVSTTPISASAVTADGVKILLPDFQVGDSEDWSSRIAACKNVSFVAIGQYALIGHFIGVGNPYPVDQNWFVHLPSRKVVDPGIENEGYLEVASSDCLMSIVRADSITPTQQDKWCVASGESKFRRVSGVMALNDPEGINRDAKKYYWFTCDRESGVGKASEKIQTIPVRETIAVTDPGISARMDEQCAAWARSSSTY